jgi:PRTRC genetic system ThiF family protein
MRHYVENYILNPTHRVGILLIGTGGTGSQVLNNLAKMNHALMQLGHPGLFVVAVDDDEVSPANLGRQIFAVSDVGQNKASVLVTRLNSYFGTDWECCAGRITASEGWPESLDWFAGYCNIVVTCVDTGKAREEIAEVVKNLVSSCDTREAKPLPFIGARETRGPSYWLDFGNSRTTGQIVLGTIQPVRQPESQFETTDILPTILDLYPELAGQDSVDDTPSCSMREALAKQDLFVNSVMADLGMNLLWRLFRDGYLEVHGAFLNLADMISSPLRVDRAVWERFVARAGAVK